MSEMPAGAAKLLKVVDVSRETIDRLETYEALLKKWNSTINLVSPSTLDDVWQRHFVDSAQLWSEKPETARTWLDLGSGAGFPGLVIAILAAEISPNLSVELLESDIRKATFLRKVCQETGIVAKVEAVRVESAAPRAADVISARALAPLDKLLGYATRHGTPSTVYLFPKGRNHESELTEARKYWKFELKKIPSLTDPSGAILKIESVERV